VPGGRFAPVGNPNWRSFFFTPWPSSKFAKVQILRVQVQVQVQVILSHKEFWRSCK
jgi:hypothetical protein